MGEGEVLSEALGMSLGPVCRVSRFLALLARSQGLERQSDPGQLVPIVGCGSRRGGV